ncbi:MAG: hypothetical protein PHC61_01245 [Chitinivibrionales bacterium]|nr:hypothetical protein [Chitinivibrionales bacterium]
MIKTIKPLVAFVKSLSHRPIFGWVIAFIVLNCIVTEDGGVNPNSRFAALKAMTEQGTLAIDNYLNLSYDWALARSGHYYSNKAPGPALLAAPIFALVNIAHGGAIGPGTVVASWVKALVSILLQALPWALLVLWLPSLFPGRFSLGGHAVHFMALAMLFGNTAAIFMNTFFGHAMTAFFLCLATICCCKKRYGLFGLSFGWALLSEYSVALFLPLFVVVIVNQTRNSKWIRPVITGALFPAVLWIWYHWVCFGNPFVTALRYENPLFLGPPQGRYTLFGMLTLQPNVKIIGELLFGANRGILVTQPWILVVTIATGYLAIIKKLRQDAKEVAAICIPGLLLLLWVNSGFYGWDAGGSAGPRYLAMVFPVFALLGGLIYDDLGKLSRWLLWLALLVALAFRGSVFATTILVNRVPLWQFQWHAILADKTHWAFAKLAAYYLILSLPLIKIYLDDRKPGRILS